MPRTAPSTSGHGNTGAGKGRLDFLSMDLSGRARLRPIHRDLRGEIPEGDRVPGEGSCGVARLLRLSSGALGALAHHQSDRWAFATIRHRSDRAKGCVTRATMLAYIFKLALAAEQSFGTER